MNCKIAEKLMKKLTLVEEFERRLRKERVVFHYGFRESLAFSGFVLSTSECSGEGILCCSHGGGDY